MTSNVRSIAVALTLLVAAPQLALSQGENGELNAERRQALQILLSRVCEAGQETQLTAAFAGFAGEHARELVLTALAYGAPEEQASATREAAKRRYAMRRELLSKNNGKLFDKQTAERLRGISEQTFIDTAEEVLDLIHRENALLALAVFGDAAAIPAIEAAVEARPSLSRLGAEAVEAIRAR